MGSERAAVRSQAKFVAGDLFCGGGGFSKGFGRACEALGIKNVRLIAVNHSQAAIETHKANHPWAEHHCARVDQLDPRKLVPEGRMKILIASPECTNHANARGGRPINDQSRSTAWDIVKWAQELYIENIIIENVREIMSWGPLGANGRPLKSKAGQIFRQWIAAIQACGYNLEHRILNSADYGAATTRKRFFLIAKRGNRKIYWPVQTHAKDADRDGDLFRRLKPWRGAHEVIDFKKPSRSIFNRKKPLAPKTLQRIEAGILKYWGAYAEPFLVLLRGTAAYQIKASPHSTKDPLPTVTGGGIHAGLVQPFIITPGGADLPGGRSVLDPLPTVLCHDRFGMVEPFILQQQSGGAPRCVRKPLPSIATKGAQALVQPFIVGTGGPEGAGEPQGVEKPLGTVLTRNHKGVVQPFIVPFFGERKGQAPRTHGITEPMPAVTSHGAGALVEPFLVQPNHGGGVSGRVHPINEPMRAITTERSHALVEPFLVKYHGSEKGGHSIRKPMPTVTTVEGLGMVAGVVEVDGQRYGLDIHFRMLEDDELARAMGFDGHEFTGTKKQKVLMIGNAVEVNQAEAICKAVLKS
jgi:DNA (cytosine-5)-methyltransferase 1